MKYLILLLLSGCTAMMDEKCAQILCQKYEKSDLKEFTPDLFQANIQCKSGMYLKVDRGILLPIECN